MYKLSNICYETGVALDIKFNEINNMRMVIHVEKFINFDFLPIMLNGQGHPNRRTQRTNFQSIYYFAYSLMKQNLEYQKLFGLFRYDITLFLIYQQGAHKIVARKKSAIKNKGFQFEQIYRNRCK